MAPIRVAATVREASTLRRLKRHRCRLPSLHAIHRQVTIQMRIETPSNYRPATALAAAAPSVIRPDIKANPNMATGMAINEVAAHTNVTSVVNRALTMLRAIRPPAKLTVTAVKDTMGDSFDVCPACSVFSL